MSKTNTFLFHSLDNAHKLFELLNGCSLENRADMRWCVTLDDEDIGLCDLNEWDDEGKPMCLLNSKTMSARPE